MFIIKSRQRCKVDFIIWRLFLDTGLYMCNAELQRNYPCFRDNTLYIYIYIYNLSTVYLYTCLKMDKPCAKK